MILPGLLFLIRKYLEGADQVLAVGGKSPAGTPAEFFRNGYGHFLLQGGHVKRLEGSGVAVFVLVGDDEGLAVCRKRADTLNLVRIRQRPVLAGFRVPQAYGGWGGAFIHAGELVLGQEGGTVRG